MRYCKLENISLKLRGRLQLEGEAMPPVFGSALGANVVSSELITLSADTAEAWIESILGQVYQVPFADSRAIAVVGSICEDLAIADIALTHYQQDVSAELGGDRGFGSVLRRNALLKLQMYVASHGINIPGLPVMPNPIAGAQSVALPGAIFLAGELQPDTISRSSAILLNRKPIPTLELF